MITTEQLDPSLQSTYVDTLEKIELKKKSEKAKESYSPFYSQPILSGPIEHCLIQQQLQWENFSPKLIKEWQDIVEENFSQLADISKQESDLAEASIRLATKRQNWQGLWEHCSSLVTASSHLFAGAQLFLNGFCYPGCFLLSVGILDISAQVFSQQNLWEPLAQSLAPNNRDRQKQIMDHLPTAITMISALASCFNAYSGETNPLFESVSSSSFGSLFGSCATIGSSISQAGLGLSKSKETLYDGSLKILDAEHQKVKAFIQQFQSYVNVCLQSGKEATRVVNRCLKESAELKSRIINH